MISRLVVVQRWPAVPTAPNTMATMAISRLASGVRMMALFPPSSRMDFPRRFPTTSATRLPIRVLPVALMRATRSSWLMASPISLSPCTRQKIPSGSSLALRTDWRIFCTAAPLAGVFSEGFQMQTLPQMAASMAFHDQTATGKLNALTIPTMPKGCHCSYILWLGRSECMVRPWSWRLSPTAKSQISIISWTSPRPSWRLLPIS